ncbi:hypothetical protein [Brevibacillus laterosporus]|uniref:hypothetical protein n=1 Tax=Brevibacillus laterosporus TaxID=1465 RepID=UPI001EF32953|nr:hypothetical protein [Brevibacillus laterosporus]MCG7320200.1 hypothetical protein [Brevibacillus laterosporus]
MANVVCDYYGKKHKMYHRGTADIKDSNTGKFLRERYGLYYCKCGEYFTCNGRPHLDDTPIGKYILFGDWEDYEISKTALDIWYGKVTVDSDDIRKTSSSTRSDMNFYPNPKD